MKHLKLLILCLCFGGCQTAQNLYGQEVQPRIVASEVQAFAKNPIRFRVTDRPGGTFSLGHQSPGFRKLDEPLWNSARLYLISGKAAGQTYTPLHGPFFLNKSDLANNEKVSFYNVPPGTYYVAASTYEGLNGSGRNTTIDKPGEGMIRVVDGGNQRAYPSQQGGKDDDGYVIVHPDLSVEAGAYIKLKLYAEEDD